MSNAVTIIPSSYPALESEVYASLDSELDRETLVPEPAEQLGLEADCFLGEDEFA